MVGFLKIMVPILLIVFLLMTEVFESYEQEFCKYTNISNKKLESFNSYSSGNKKMFNIL